MGVAGRRHPADGRGEHGVTDALKHAGLVLHSCRRGGIARLQQQGPHQSEITVFMVVAAFIYSAAFPVALALTHINNRQGELSNHRGLKQRALHWLSRK